MSKLWHSSIVGIIFNVLMWRISGPRFEHITFPTTNYCATCYSTVALYLKVINNKFDIEQVCYFRIYTVLPAHLSNWIVGQNFYLKTLQTITIIIIFSSQLKIRGKYKFYSSPLFFVWLIQSCGPGYAFFAPSGYFTFW